jgi:glycosyltransferase involved in cell wall biosynthesis
MKIYHVENWAIVGGIGTYSRDLALTFPEFQHEIVFINQRGMQYPYIKWFNDQGIKTSFTPNGQITDEMFKDDEIICLHNITGKSIKEPYNWLGNHRVFNIHHAVTPLFNGNTELDLFVSYWVRNRYYGFETCMKQVTVLPPCVRSKEYISIQPRKGVKVPVIGRIQSSTNQEKGKFNKCIETLSKVTGCEFLIVGNKDSICTDPRFKFADIQIGAMPSYLSQVDIFVLDCPTTESWSRVATEAMLAGKPVIARNYGDGLTEQMIKANAPLTNNESDFIKTMQAFVNNESLRLETGTRLRTWAFGNASEETLRDGLIDYILKGM